MRAITIFQPYPHAIFHLGKAIENRGHRIRPGPILIHAGAFHSAAELDEAFAAMRAKGLLTGPAPLVDQLPYAGVVGIADVVSSFDEDTTAPAAARAGVDLRWWNPSSVGNVLANAQALPRVPWRGQQGIFDVPLRTLLEAAPSRADRLPWLAAFSARGIPIETPRVPACVLHDGGRKA